MQYDIKTKQGNNYIVSDDSTWLWIEIERDLGYTVTQAAEKMSQGSLDVITCMLYKASKAAGMSTSKARAMRGKRLALTQNHCLLRRGS